MTEPSTGPVAAQIAARLTDALAPTHLDVINDSAHHAGHMGDDGSGESHFSVTVESAAVRRRCRACSGSGSSIEALADLLRDHIPCIVDQARTNRGRAE